MGKGYQNYMCKKFFHPTSFENIKRKWMNEQQRDFEKKKQDDLMEQYNREQEMLTNRALMGDKKAQLGLSFMYDAPAGIKEEEKEVEEHGEKKYKFEWQRKYKAPRETYVQGKEDEAHDQPFGIEVRHNRCIKCRQFGHMNTDHICPLFGKNLTAEPPPPGSNPSELMAHVRDQMADEGILVKRNIWDHELNEKIPNQRVLPHIDDTDPEVQFLKSLTPEQRAKLLKKLEKHDRKQAKKEARKNSTADDDTSPRKHRHRRHGDSDRNHGDGHRKKHKKSKKKRRHSSEDSSDSEGPLIKQEEGFSSSHTQVKRRRRSSADHRDYDVNRLSSKDMRNH